MANKNKVQGAHFKNLSLGVYPVSIFDFNLYDSLHFRLLCRALNARWALPFYPGFQDEMSNASDEKLVKRKIA